MCSNRHGRRNNCKQRSVQSDEVERQIEEYYNTIQLSEAQEESLKALLYRELDERRKEELSSQGNIRLEKDKIARKQKKLLEAHYADAIPLDLLKQEQATLERAMADIETRFSALEQNYMDVKKNLDMVLELATNARRLYKIAPEHIKRMFNQVFFEKVLVRAHDDLKLERTPIFEALLSAQTKQLAISSELFGQSLPQKMISYAQCLSKQLLVTSRRNTQDVIAIRAASCYNINYIPSNQRL